MLSEGASDKLAFYSKELAKTLTISDILLTITGFHGHLQKKSIMTTRPLINDNRISMPYIFKTRTRYVAESNNLLISLAKLLYLTLSNSDIHCILSSRGFVIILLKRIL